MDNKKDIENSGQKNTDSVSVKNEFNPIDFFQKDEGFVFVYKKTEKLATALYMVSNLFNDSEPMKWTLRSKVSQLLSFIIGFKDVLESREDEFVNDTKTKVLEIVSMLEIASRSGLVSPMNFSILKSEFIHLTQFLMHFKKYAGHRADLKENFFEVSKVSRGGMQTGDISHAQGHHSDVPDLHKRTNRQNIIIGLLKKKDNLTINDIAEVIRDCSEKTIQRELISLILAGVVQKVGQRRWSRYSLISQQ